MTQPTTPLVCECGDTTAFHSTLGKKVCLKPGCHCGGFKARTFDVDSPFLDPQSEAALQFTKEGQ